MNPLTTWPNAKRRAQDFSGPIREVLSKANKPMNAKEIDAAIGGAADIHTVLCRMAKQGLIKRLGKVNHILQWAITDMPLETGKPAVMKCRCCCLTKPYTLEHFGADKRAQHGMKSTCRICTREQQRQYNLRHSVPKTPRQEKLAASMESPPGRWKETATASGKIVRNGKEWRPHREGRRYNVPGLLGYTSPLARL